MFKELVKKHATHTFNIYTITGPQIKELRNSLNMTQKYFAFCLGVNKKTIEKWERRTRIVRGPTDILLHILSVEPETVLKYLGSKHNES